MKILITGCGGNHFLETLPCYDAEIIGVASVPDDSLRHLLSKYIKVRKCSEPGYIEELMDLCVGNEIEVLIPTLDAEMVSIANRIKDFENLGIKVSITNTETIGTAVDKIKFSDFLKENGFDYADYRVIENVDDLVYKAMQLGYPRKPICAKLSNKGGSRGFRIIDDTHDFFDDFVNKKPISRYLDMSSMLSMLKKKGKFPPIMLQEYLPGGEYSVDMVCDHGEVIAIAGRENVVVDNSIPLVSIVKKNDRAYRISKEIASRLMLDGNIGIDFIKRGAGEVVPIEINARITATVGLIAKAGLNLPMIQLKRLMGENYDVPEVKYGTMMKKSYKAVYSGAV